MATIQRFLSAAGLLLLFGVAEISADQVFTVTSTADSGPGSLRQAIVNANNASGADAIHFNITGTGPHRIQLSSALPIVSGQTTIDGFTQPGATANTLATGNDAILKIELRGNGAAGNVIGLQINGPNSVVRGLVLNGFTFGITFNGSSAVMEGCFVGSDTAGGAAVPNGEGVRVNAGADGAIIGGTSPAARNLISGNAGRGLHVFGAALNVTIQGNYIGTNAAGIAPLPNSDGVTVAASAGNPDNTVIAGNLISGNVGFGIALLANGTAIRGNRIGTNAAGTGAIPNANGIGTTTGGSVPYLGTVIGGGGAGAGNVISGNSQNGISLATATSGFVMRGNFIGTTADGSSPLGNVQNGILLALNNHTSTTIGGTAAGEGNIIAFNGRDGIAISNGTGARITANAIHSNGSTAADLGIDLGPDGITTNDSGDADAGPNNLQNFPVITATSFANGQVQITGTLNSASNTAYRLEFFATGQTGAVDPLQGRSFIGSATATTNASGSVSFDVLLPAAADAGQITATATDPSGNTSEFGLPLPVITSPLGVRVTVGQPFYYLLKATSDPSGYGAGSLPKGLSYDSFLDAIIGTPSETGTFECTLTASNQAGTTSKILNMQVQSVPASGLTITSSYSSTGRTGQPFQFQVITTGGSAATRITASNLPPGLAIDDVTGIISGTPAADGSFSVQLTATDGPNSTSETLQLTFISDPTVPVIVTPSSTTLVEGQPFSYTIVAPATTDPADQTEFTLIGALPDGLGFDQSDGQIVGTYTPASARYASRGKPLTGGVITNVQLFATNSNGTSTIPLVFFLAPKGVVNISTRLAVGTDQNVLIAGFIVTGNAPKKLIIRGIAPSLGIAGALQDPTLELREGENLLGSNDDWRSNQEQDIIATTIPPSDNRESALVAILNPGAYTAVISGKNGSTGIGLAEVYDLGTASLESTSASKLANISTRGLVQTNDDVMIGGFIVSGAPTKVIVRAIGPSLANGGVAGALEDTTLDFVDGNGALIVANDDWRTGGQEQQIIETTVPPDDNRESAVVATINPGAYTAVIRGKDGRTGVALVEVYVLN